MLRAVRHQKYPLGPLAELREKKVEEAAGVLAAALAEREAAARALRGAELRREGHAQAVARVHAAELEALSRGDLRARDLARVDAWAVRVSAEREALAAVVDHARIADAEARERQGAAKGSMASCSADARLVAGHRARWDEARRRSLEASEEEALSDAWHPKR
jgi:hypothetical protein